MTGNCGAGRAGNLETIIPFYPLLNKPSEGGLNTVPLSRYVLEALAEYISEAVAVDSMFQAGPWIHPEASGLKQAIEERRELFREHVRQAETLTIASFGNAEPLRFLSVLGQIIEHGGKL